MWFGQMHAEWQSALQHLKPNIDDLEHKLAAEPHLAPTADRVMAAFALPPTRVRVIVVGQDPYPGLGVAVGRAFAVSSSSPIPASLRNIFHELGSDLATRDRPAPDLLSWQEQGVWLINRHLTTLSGNSGAHFDIGWQEVTDTAIRHVLSTSAQPVALVLWGAQAQRLLKNLGQEELVGDSPRLVIKSAHPSPLSARRGFFGSRPFSAINAWFQANGVEPIDWTR